MDAKQEGTEGERKESKKEEVRKKDWDRCCIAMSMQDMGGSTTNEAGRVSVQDQSSRIKGEYEK